MHHGDRYRLVAEYPDLFEGVGLLEGDVYLETDPTVSPVQMPLWLSRLPIQISLQTTEVALDFRLDHFIVIILASGKSLQ